MTVVSVRQMPASLSLAFREALGSRSRNVGDARRLLSPHQGRLFEFGVDDGVYPDTLLWGRYETVVHRPSTGFQLVLRGLMPLPDEEARRRDVRRRERSALPLAVITALPEPFRFLQEAPERWALPAPLVHCSPCGFRYNTGRFCVRCGRLVRRGRWMGEGYIAMQRAIRAEGALEASLARACGCGGWVHAWERFCAKCGREEETAT